MTANTTATPRGSEVVSVQALRDLIRAYVNTLENGRDRILFLGGDCDSLEKMEQSDPALEAARAAIESAAAPGMGGDDLEIAEAALQRFHDKFMERAHVDPSTGYPEYGSQEDYYIDLCAALDAVKGLQDVPSDPREQEYAS